MNKKLTLVLLLLTPLLAHAADKQKSTEKKESKTTIASEYAQYMQSLSKLNAEMQLAKHRYEQTSTRLHTILSELGDPNTSDNDKAKLDREFDILMALQTVRGNGIAEKQQILAECLAIHPALPPDRQARMHECHATATSVLNDSESTTAPAQPQNEPNE